MRYIWREVTPVPSEPAVRCKCGGRLRHYRVHPSRSPKYLNNIMVCDNAACEEAVVHRGTKRERRGRLIIL